MNDNRGEEAIFKESEEPVGLDIVGADFSEKMDLEKFIDSFKATGFQATNIGKAIDIAKKMRNEEITIFLGYTSNMVTSGVREQIRYLVQNKLVHCIVTTAGGIEEDIIKSLKPFVLGKFEMDGVDLRRRGINRAGNILIPNSRYIEFEKIFTPFLEKLLEEQKKTGKIINSTEFCRRLGELGDKSSILYWATKNNIPVFCPGITDGSIGDMIYFFKNEHPEFKIDVTDDLVKLIDIVFAAKETGAIILGGSLPKHHIMNANLMREGTKYTIYINTAIEEDGSNAGAPPDEAKSWGKASAGAESVKVFCDATIAFPILVAGAFRK